MNSVVREGENCIILFKSLRSILWILRLLLIEKSPRTFLIAEVVFSSFYPFSNGSTLRDISLAMRILNKFFRFRLSVQFSPLDEHVFNQGVKDRVEKEKKKNE